MDLIVDVVGDSDNNPSYYKIMKTRGRLVRVNTTSCEKRYVPHAVAGEIEGGKDTSYYGRVINDNGYVGVFEDDALNGCPAAVGICHDCF